ncbi:MAG: hypothetical protein Q8R70_05070, partial [Methanoregula sp.]|nr:hypothetical protein [Methanoregula sp.]
SPKIGTRAIRIRGTEAMQRTIPTTGYSDIIVSFYMGASSLENVEYVTADLWDGTAWTEMARITNGDARENSQLYAYTFTAPASADDKSNFIVRFRNLATGTTNDNMFIDNVLVTGIPL